MFAYLTQSGTEAELDAVIGAMTLDGYLAKIACPVLLAAGEYDPRSPIDEVYRMFDQLRRQPNCGSSPISTTCRPSAVAKARAHWAAPLHGVMCDWLRDRFADKPLRHPGQVVYVEANSAGPNSANVSYKRAWYEA